MTNLDQVIVNRLIQTNLSTCFLHQKTFPQFKGIHQGQDVCLLASGITAAKYKYVEGNYLDVEIVSINPVGLKGIFKDEFTV